MIWINFAEWTGKSGYFLSWRRIYTKKGGWTPFCHVHKRYDSWLGFWKKPESMCWLLVGRTIMFASIPSDYQMKEAIHVAKGLGLVPIDQALASGGMFELYLKPEPPEPDWQITVPDGCGQTALVTYKGERVPGITSLTYTLPAGGVGKLVMDIRAQDIAAAMKIFDDDVELQCE